LVCIASEALLVGAGVLGAGPVLATSGALTAIARWGGAVFLGAYGALAIRRALRAGSGAFAADGPAEASLPRAMATLLALTFLNPHVYLDTVVLLGAVGGAQPPDGRIPFVLGAVGASTLWFLALAYGARRLAPLFAHPRAFRALDLGTGALMLVLAAAVALAA
jgi:L-lysine exporter family protein LysE/ArgO